MARTTIVILAAAFLAVGTQVEAQGRGNRQNRGDRQAVARAQGVPPGHLPPPNRCRVWYDNRPNGRQPAPTSCSRAEAVASRERNARVIYGETVYDNAGRSGVRSRYPDARDRDRDRDRTIDNNRGVRRDGRVRDPRISGGTIDPDGRDSRYYNNTPAFQNGYRDGLTKGREDGEDNDRADVNRHSWYRSATRGYDDDDYGSRTEYQRQYKQGFEAGYAEGYRVYARR